MSQSTPILGLLALWLLLACTTGGLLAHRGHPPMTAAAALLLWPALLPLLAEAPAGNGPYTNRITDTLSALRSALSDPALGGTVHLATLEPIEGSLRRADVRIAAVDRLLADPNVAADGAVERLRAARSRAAEEVEGVLRQLVHVRVELGLVALAGETHAVRDHLATLAARAQAIEEVG